MSFYKGSTVVRQDTIGTCSIFGTIWAKSSMGKDTLKHEYGHSIQERLMGGSYLFTVAVPSAFNYHFGSHKPEDYYSLPWERTADWLGGVERECYKRGSLGWAITENLLGPIVIPFYYAFGY